MINPPPPFPSYSFPSSELIISRFIPYTYLSYKTIELQNTKAAGKILGWKNK
jgi:hypothetical protein